MADLFISYARADRETAQRLADALEHVGWSVWWDPQIPIGRHFEEVIEEQLALAKCVVVLWSRHGIRSRWVRSEAADGRDRDILAPVLLEDVEIPLSFRGIQTADLREWNGDPDHPGFSDLVRDISVQLDPLKKGRTSEPRSQTSRSRFRLFDRLRPKQSPSVEGSAKALAGMLVGALITAIGIAVAFQYAFPSVPIDTGLGLLFALTGLIVMSILRAVWRFLRDPYRNGGG
jgi:TIR domain